jgi:hypothetical protein
LSNEVLNRRKHFSKMTTEELKIVREAIEEKQYTFTNYSIQRTVERVISKQSVAEAIREGFLIEVHNNKPYDFRALLRLHEDDKAVCVVVSLRARKIVTAYLNDVEDMHDSLNWSKYLWNVCITRDLIDNIIK